MLRVVSLVTLVVLVALLVVLQVVHSTRGFKQCAWIWETRNTYVYTGVCPASFLFFSSAASAAFPAAFTLCTTCVRNVAATSSDRAREADILATTSCTTSPGLSTTRCSVSPSKVTGKSNTGCFSSSSFFSLTRFLTSSNKCGTNSFGMFCVFANFDIAACKSSPSYRRKGTNSPVSRPTGTSKRGRAEFSSGLACWRFWLTESATATRRLVTSAFTTARSAGVNPCVCPNASPEASMVSPSYTPKAARVVPRNSGISISGSVGRSGDAVRLSVEPSVCAVTGTVAKTASATDASAHRRTARNIVKGRERGGVELARGPMS